MQGAHFLELFGADAFSVDPRHLEVGAQVLQRRVGEEGAEALAELALEDVRVPVAVRAERRGAVVDVERAQPVEPDRLVDCGDERRRRPPDR